MKKVILVVVILAVAVSLIHFAPVLAQPVLQLVWQNECDGEVRVRGSRVECWEEIGPPILITETPTVDPIETETPTVFPTMTITPTFLPPTVTPTPDPGATVTPTVEPTVTVTPTPEPGVPMCPHDPLLWHDLYDEAQGCRHSHEHGDNPHDADAVFGPPGAWYGALNTEIGGPFATASEMTMGHVYWKWYNHLDIPPVFTEIRPPGGSYIRDLRVLTHVTTGGPVNPPEAGGMRKRFHGGSVEANVCQPTYDRSDTLSETCGIFRMAGMFDFGNLRTSDTLDGIIYLPEEGQMANLGLAGRRTHPLLAGVQAGQWPGVVWYARTWSAESVIASVDLAIIVNDPWTYVIPGDANVTTGFIGDLSDGFNASNRDLHIAGIYLGAASPTSLVWIGGSNGAPDPNCTTLGQQGCAYVVVEDLPEVGHEQYASHGQNDREYDTSPPGESWIGFPN